jgi:hypothetical protein
MKKLYLLPILTLMAFVLIYSCSTDEEDTTPPPSVVATPEPEPPAPTQYTLTVTAGEGGTVSTEGGTFDEGTDVIVTATPEEGFIFWEWNDGSNEKERTVELNTDISIEAIFKDKTFIENGAYKAVGYVTENEELILNPDTYPLIFEFEDNQVVFNGLVYNDLASFGIYKSVGLIYGEGNTDYGLENHYISKNTVNRTYYTENGVKQSWGLVKIDEIPNKYDHNEIMSLVEGKGYWSDPIYSKIDPLDPKSYVIAFIEDAERHGVDLSFVDINQVTVNFRDSGYAGLSHLSCIDDNRVEISYYEPFWESAPYYDVVNERLTVMYHELGHDILNSNHPPTGELKQLMNQLLGETGNIVWDDSDEMFSFRRMVDDMFSGVGLNYTCVNGAKNYSTPSSKYSTNVKLITECFSTNIPIYSN